MEDCGASSTNYEQCSCSAAANLVIMRRELDRYRSMYDSEREQFEEFQQSSKELENEMELELERRDLKLIDLESARRRIASELETFKGRVEQQRLDQIHTEDQLKRRLDVAEQQSAELRQKLRVVEQANDDMERRERIHSQQLVDLHERYEKCLERCALLEMGMSFGASSATNISTTGGTDSGAEMMSTATPKPFHELAAPLENGQSGQRHESQLLIENMLKKIQAAETAVLSNGASKNGIGHL